MQLNYVKKTFHFNFPAYTSRGTLYDRECWFLILSDESHDYIGECAPIAGLSRDPIHLIPQTLSYICNYFNLHKQFPQYNVHDFPSIAFAIECIMLQKQQQQEGLIFPSNFTKGIEGIAINGLIWAGTRDQVMKQIEQKIHDGFSCIKMKIGALPFDEELKILEEVRRRYPHIEIRLDANGAFAPDEALHKLEQLAQFSIHSLEQPIAPHQWPAMKAICQQSPIPIALDEELITCITPDEKMQMIDQIKPSYLIIKPTLVGGFTQANQYIQLASERNIGWWITSALESNIGLNAIAQWTYQVAPQKVHGLGTGRIYQNNIPSPLYLQSGKLFYNPSASWDYSMVNPVKP